MGKVEKTDVKNMAVPTPSIDRRKKHTKINPQVDGIKFVILYKKNKVNCRRTLWVDGINAYCYHAVVVELRWHLCRQPGRRLLLVNRPKCCLTTLSTPLDTSLSMTLLF